MNFIRNILFSHISPLVRKGRGSPLQANDMPALPDEIDPRSISPAFHSLSLKGPLAFLLSVAKAVRKEVLIICSLSILLGGAEVFSPYLLHQLIKNMGL
jgi:hypothetical protein